MTYIYIFLILVMSATAPFCESTSISYIAAIVPFLFVMRREYLISLIIFSSAIFYRIAPGIPLSILLIYIYIFSVILDEKIIKARWSVNVLAFICSIFSIIYLVYSCENSITGSYDALAKFVSFIFFVYFSTYDKSCDTKLLRKNLFYTSLIGLFILGLHIFINPFITDEGRRTLSALHNANLVARGLAIMVVITFIYNDFSLKGKLGIIKVAAICVGIISIFMTGSRMGLVATLLTIIVCFYITTKSKSQFFKYAIIFLVLYFVARPVISIFDIDYGRFENGFTEDSITENVRLASSIILWDEAIIKHPFTGIGLGNVNSEYILEYVPDSDNMYVDVLTQLGVIGLVFILLVVLSTLQRLYRCIKKQHAKFSELSIPIAIIILQIPLSFTESIFDELVIWYAIAISNIFINAINQNECISFNHRSKFQLR